MVAVMVAGDSKDAALYADMQRAMRKARKTSSSERFAGRRRLLQRGDACIASRDGSHGRPRHGIGERAEVPDSSLVRRDR